MPSAFGPRAFLTSVTALLLVFAAVACGGESTKGQPPGPEVTAYGARLEGWLSDWRKADFPTLDRDYVNCYGPDDPQPAPSSPDPSGHTRARVACLVAAQAVEKNVGAYRDLVARLKTLASDSHDPRIDATEAALVNLHTQRLALYEEIVATLAKRDEPALVKLRGRYLDQAPLDEAVSKALANFAGAADKK